MAEKQSEQREASQQRNLAATPKWRDLLVSLSLSNLCFLYVWSQAPPYVSSNVEYFLREPHAPSHYIALVANVCGLGWVLWLVLLWVRRSQQQWVDFLGRVSFLAIFAVALNSTRLVLSPFSAQLFAWVNWQRRLGEAGALAAISTVGIGLIATLWRFPRVIFRACALILLVLSPLVAVNFFQAVRMCLRQDLGLWLQAQPRPIRQQRARAKSRVLLILFDEWDYRLTYEARIKGLDLPQLDQFRREAIDCRRAYPPGSGTMYSVPAITIGRRLDEVKVAGPSTISIREHGEKDFESWGHANSMFRLAATAGYSTAVVGWFMPYCRIFGDVCDSCEWWPASFMGFPQGRGVIESAWLQMRSLLETRGLSPFGQTIELNQYIESLQGVLRGAKSAAANRDMDFVYLHLPMTHWPFYYNRLTGRFDRRWNDRKAYWDALALGDRVLTEIRQAMTEANVWDSSTVVLTSDHSYRDSDLIDNTYDARVPLLIKCGNSKAPAIVSTELSTTLLPDFILATLSGAVGDGEQAQEWLIKRHVNASAN